MDNQVDNQDIVLVSQMCQPLYTQMLPQQGNGEEKRRRRRKKNKGGEGGVVGLKKRKLSEEQVSLLELNFGNEHKLESDRKDRLASELGLDPRQVAVWFQNRRARWKNKKLEGEYSILKKHHDSAVVDKCRLESEILKLKDKLLEAEKQIQRLSERCHHHHQHDGASSHSPSSSFSMDANAMEPPFPVEFVVQETGYEHPVFYMSDNNYSQGLEYFNLFG